MAWSTPLTAVANAALNASQWNASVRDNLLETAPAKAANAGWHFATSGTNTIAERAILQNIVATSEGTATTTYTNLATNGPILSSVTTGPAALVFINSRCQNGTANEIAYASFEVTGATTDTSSDTRAVISENPTASNIQRYGATSLMILNAGANTFRMQYKASAGTATFVDRRLIVMAL